MVSGEAILIAENSVGLKPLGGRGPARGAHSAPATPPQEPHPRCWPSALQSCPSPNKKILGTPLAIAAVTLIYLFSYLSRSATSRGMWLSGRVVRTLDLRSIGREFESWPLRYRVQPWASC